MLLASEGLGVPDTVKENFSLLNKKGIITADLASRMGKMTGFRNIAIHDYQDLDLEILKSILAKNLRDLEEFYVEVLGYYGYGKG